MDEIAHVKISGHKPAKDALRMLESYADDEEIKSVSIRINRDVPDMEQTTITGDKVDSSDEDEGQSSTEDEQDKEAEREEGDIRAHTSHHRVLHQLSQYDGAVPGRDVRDDVDGVSESSVYPALTQLWERKMADRERVDDVANPYYKYEITDYGRETLKQMGEPAETED